MELPESQIKGIQSLRDNRVLDEKTFPYFVELTFDILLKKKNEDELRSTDTSYTSLYLFC